MGKSQKRNKIINNKIKLPMKNFLKTNYFKLITSISLFFFSLGFFVFSISNLRANNGINNEIKQTKNINPGDNSVTGVGIDANYAYLVDFEVNGRNSYYKIPLSKFKYSNDSGVD